MKKKDYEIITALHYKPLYHINRSEIWGKNVQTAGYNGACTSFPCVCLNMENSAKIPNNFQCTNIYKYRVSHGKVNKVIWLCWGYSFWFLVIFRVICVFEKGTFMPNSSVFIFWCGAPSMVQLVKISCSIINFELFWLLWAFFG